MSVNVKQNGSLTKVGGLYNTVDIEQELSDISTGTTAITDDDLIVTEQDSNSVWYRKTFSKIWDYIRDKIGIADSGSTFLRKNGTWGTPANNRVTQSPSNTNSAYEVLLSGTADNTERTETSNKNSSFTHNPSTAATTIERQNATTTSAYSDLSLGNNTADGTVGATHGRLRVFGQGQYYVSIWDGLNVLTNNRALHLPNRQGVIATTNLVATDESQKTTVDDVTARRADQAYAIGDHFIIDNQFCTAIAAISSGEVLTANTNYVTGAIEDYLTIKKANITLNSNLTWLSMTNANRVCRRYGNMVEFRGYFTVSGMPTLSGNTTFFTLPWTKTGATAFCQVRSNLSGYPMVMESFRVPSDSKNIIVQSGVQLPDAGYYIQITYMTEDAF